MLKTAALGGFGVTLLDGVTGSGKTEVYLEAAAAVLAADPDAQVLILLPEIALTQAVIARVATRFGAQPGSGTPTWPRPRADGSGRRWRRANAGSWRAPDRRCSCRSAS